MFRKTMCSSSGGKLNEYNFWYNHYVLVAVRYAGRDSILTCISDSHQHRVIIPEVVFIQLSSWGWAHSCSEHVDDLNKLIIEEIVRKVVYLPELSEEARSKKC